MAMNINIQKEQEVTKIDYSQEYVEVSTQKGKFTSGKVIVTLPLGVLKRKTVAFYPDLPAHTQQSIDQIGFGVEDKLVL